MADVFAMIADQADYYESHIMLIGKYDHVIKSAH